MSTDGLRRTEPQPCDAADSNGENRCAHEAAPASLNLMYQRTCTKFRLKNAPNVNLFLPRFSPKRGRFVADIRKYCEQLSVGVGSRQHPRYCNDRAPLGRNYV